MYQKRIWLYAALFAILILVVGGAWAAQRSKSSTAKKPSPAGKKSTAVKSQRPAGKAKGRPSRRRRAAYRGPSAPTPERIRQIQQALTRSGHYRREPTGKLDANTSAALGSFQEANGLKRTGKLNAWTLRRLEQYGLPPSSRASAGQAAGSNP